MSIQVQTVGLTDLRLGADIVKANYAAGRTIGGQAGRVMGHTRAVMVRLPVGFGASVSHVILGRDGNNSGNFNSTSDTVLRIGGNGAGALQFRPSVRYRNGSTNAYAGTNEAEGQYTALPAMTLAPARFLLLEGVRNTGTNSSPVWRGWSAICQLDSGTPASALAPTAINSAWISGTSGALMRQVFAAVGGSRPPPLTGCRLRASLLPTMKMAACWCWTAHQPGWNAGSWPQPRAGCRWTSHWRWKLVTGCS